MARAVILAVFLLFHFWCPAASKQPALDSLWHAYRDPKANVRARLMTLNELVGPCGTWTRQFQARLRKSFSGKPGNRAIP
ncbi:MAG: hypothetical protein IPH00_07595 [Flavobacteriales bacterium]|nr:hypothetical protein [Flavobacteriales bacterium]